MQQRDKRMSEIVREAVAFALVAHVPEAQVTVMYVDISPDLRYADVWISRLNRDITDAETLKLIKVQIPKIKEELAKKVKSKFVPKIRFRVDNGQSHADQIDSLLNSI